jgi:hypothetical protein
MDSPTPEVLFRTARRTYHARVAERALRTEKGVPSNADRANRTSSSIALGIATKAGMAIPEGKLSPQTSGTEFERATAGFLSDCFFNLQHLRPGDWRIHRIGDSTGVGHSIEAFEQYRHLTSIAEAAQKNADLKALIGSDYIIKPDIVVFRMPVEDSEINQYAPLVDDSVALMSNLRKSSSGSPVLHASVSCKLTIRSDRSQNSRSEALNLIRNRRGKLPHVIVVTAEPLPSRIASVALGSGDIDCVYHFALAELQATVRELPFDDAAESLDIMIRGRRLKDISDLPLDLAV